MFHLIKNRTMQRFWLAILGLLGFTACGNAPLDMYGSPTVDFTVKGKVTDSAGVPIKGIVVSSKDVSSFIDCSGLSAVTADDGTFTTNKMREFGVIGTLIFTDSDGEANGGDFATLEVDLGKLPKSQTKEGDGSWYRGEYEVTADVKLEKK